MFLRGKLPVFDENAMPDARAYCMSCQRMTAFRREPVEVKTRIGARKRLVGRCKECGHKVSCFLPSDEGPTVHSVKMGEDVIWELRRASSLTETSQRAIVENIVMENLEEFISDELEALEEGGVISAGERAKREHELELPIEQWTPPEAKRGDDPHDEPALLRFLKDLFS